MKIFISWSGSFSSAIGQVLREYLPYMLRDLEVFLSKHDLGSGERWAAQLAMQLEQTSFGIICLTPHNQVAPWLLFEAGALAKHMDGRVCGVLLDGMKAADIAGPLAQFQHTEWSKDGIRKLMRDINAKLEAPADTMQLDKIFETWWPQIETVYMKALAENRQVAGNNPATKRSEREILEEILERTRALERVSGFASAAEDKRESDGIAFSGFVDRMIASLTPEQAELLKMIAIAKHGGNQVKAQEIAASADPENMAELLRKSLVTKDKSGKYLMNRFIIRLLGNRVRHGSASPNG